MELRQLNCFLACARLHSLTLAAEELYTTQPHVSMIIRSLEQELGTALFVRKARGVELTEAGKQIYTYAINAVRNAEIIAELGRKEHVPLLRIASNSSSHMAVLLTNFYLQQKSEMKLQYRESGLEEMIERLAAGMDDLGFLFVPDSRRAVLQQMMSRRFLEYVPLLSTDLVLYVRRAHPLAEKDWITLEQLAELKLIQADDDFFSVEAILEETAAFRGKKRHLSPVVSTNSGHMMIQMLENTDLCNVGSYWLSSSCRQHDFKKIRIEGLEKQISFGYMKYRGKPLIPELTEFLEFLKGALEKEYPEET